MTTQQIRLSDIEGKVVKTNKGRWLRCKSGSFETQFRAYAWLQDDEIIVLMQDKWPMLREFQRFTLESQLKRDIYPNQPFLFELDNEFLFVVRLDNYRLSFNFLYESTDKRVGWAVGKWTSPAGTLMRHLVDQELIIQWEDDKVVMKIGYKMTVPSQ